MILLKCPKCLHHWKMEQELLRKEVVANCPSCQARWKISPKVPVAHNAVIADTNREFRVFLEEQLKLLGFNVKTVESGTRLMGEIQNRPDLIVANVFLPEKLGVEVCEWVKKTDEFHHIPFILVGSLFRVERYRRPANSLYGADDYIEEGVQKDEFQGIVRRLTGFGITGRSRSISPLEEHLRRRFRIHIDSFLTEPKGSDSLHEKIKEVISIIVREAPHVDPSLVRNIADEYLAGQEGDHD